MAQIQGVDFLEITTPGLGQRCLYYAALISLNKPATEATTKALKQDVHNEIQTFLARNTKYKRNDLHRALKLTDPNTSLKATDEVLPALANVLKVSKIQVLEGELVTEIAALEPQDGNPLPIGYVPGHFYALREKDALWDHILPSFF